MVSNGCVRLDRVQEENVLEHLLHFKKSHHLYFLILNGFLMMYIINYGSHLSYKYIVSVVCDRAMLTRYWFLTFLSLMQLSGFI